MKNTSLMMLFVSLFAISLPLAHAEDDDKFLQLSLWDPVQIFSADESITGLRLSLFYGVNQDVTGVDLGFIAHKVKGDFKGLQLGIWNSVEGDSEGLQWGMVNYLEGNASGWQDSYFNRVKGTARGLQTGWVNYTGKMRGLQLGLLNITQSLYGLQLGILNIHKDGPHGILPFVNWSF